MKEIYGIECGGAHEWWFYGVVFNSLHEARDFVLRFSDYFNQVRKFRIVKFRMHEGKESPREGVKEFETAEVIGEFSLGEYWEWRVENKKMKLYNRFFHLIWDLMMSNPYTDKIMWWIETNILDFIFMKRITRRLLKKN